MQLDVGLTDSQANLADEFTVSVKQKNVDQQYSDLLDLGQQRTDKLEESLKAYTLVREAGELGQWIVEKVIRSPSSYSISLRLCVRYQYVW